MEHSEIKPGDYYLVTDPYEEAVVVVRVVEKSDAVEDHWRCVRRDGRKVLLPSELFIQRTLSFN